MATTKQSDEIFCRSCGEPIKKEAEICPECGVRNAKSEKKKQRTQSPPPAGGAVHDPSQYETTVSDSWYYGIIAGTVLWVLFFALSSSASGESPLLGMFVLIAWMLLPIAAYFDMQYIRANGRWNPNTVLWILAMAVWIVNIPAALVYLYRRHEVLGKP